jgi:hypothetical protein
MGWRRAPLLIVAVASAFAACGDDGESASTTTTSASTSTSTTEAPETEEVENTAFPVPFTVQKPVEWTTENFGAPADVTFLVDDDAGSGYEVGIIHPLFDDGTTVDDLIELGREFGPDQGYKSSEPQEAMVGPLTATAVEIEATTSNPGTMFVLAGGGSWGLYPGNAGRVYLIDINGTIVVVTIEAPEEHLEDFLDEAEPIVQSIKFST